ncbi:hypothetical protein ZTR_04444 [Talaromyces verruculosus]|nr:hypothetical protein ZTR_04444 [Talaromyces verruculosus]
MENNNEKLEATSDMRDVTSNEDTRSLASTSSITRVGDHNSIGYISTTNTNETFLNPEQQDDHRSASLSRIPDLSNWRRALIFIGLYFDLFLVLLDTSFMSTAEVFCSS